MSRKWTRVAVLAVVVLLGFHRPGWCGEPLPVLTGEWAPYVSESLQGGGMAAEIVTHAFLAAGLEPETSFAPWTRCESEIKQGRVFAGFPFTPTEERREYALFSEPLFRSRTVFFYMPERLESFRYLGLDGLRHLKVGGTRGYFYVPLFRRAELQVDYANEAELSFRKLFLGRVDVVAEARLVGWEILRRTYPNQISRFKASERALSVDPMALMVSKRWPGARKLLERFNQGMRRIRDNGVLEAISNKYGRR
jgi:polar amino acid transport system substrate-binding protein